jgi:hypothetical protein
MFAMRFTRCCFRLLIISLFCLHQTERLQAQETDLDKAMEEELKKLSDSAVAPPYIRAFRTTRTSNGHSVETLPKGILDVKVQHRFGYLSGGWSNFFGLDDATIRIGGDFGITDRLMIGGGRATYEKQWDGFLKYKILQQQTGARKMPVSLSVLFSTMLQTMPTPPDLHYEPDFSDRFFYAGQVLLARKFGKGFTLQFMPTFVHYNIVPLETDKNDIFSLGLATAIRITPRADIVVEYYYNLPSTKFEDTQNSLSVGVDLETGGHVFQIMFTNASGIAERPFITESTGNFFEGDIRIGFNVSRNFQLMKPKKPKSTG